MIKKYKLFLESKGRNINDIIKKRNLGLNISKLDVGFEKLTSLEGIEKLYNLKILDISDNNLTSLEGIENLTELEEIFLSFNKLTSIEEIENLNKLKILLVGNNRLKTLEGIRNLTELEICDFNNNPIIYSSTDLETIKKEIETEKYNYKVIEEVIRKDYRYKTKDGKEFKPIKLEKPFVVTDKGERISILDIYPLPQDTYTEI